MKEFRVILVDDNEPFRKALKNLLVFEFGAKIIGEAANGEEFNKLDNVHEADIIFMDIMMPGINGIELTQKSLWKYPHLKIVAITMHSDKVYIKSLIEAGFKGCILKTDLVSGISKALQNILKGGLYFPSEINLFSE
jgi:DNA-binding NarL/FixJ family response regulator